MIKEMTQEHFRKRLADFEAKASKTKEYLEKCL